MEKENKNKNEETMKNNVQEEETKKKSIKGKIIVILVLTILIIISAVAYHQVTSKQRKAEEFFGNDNCEAILHMSTMDIAEHTCKICGAEFQDSSMHADICKKCAEETNRCEFCGKKLSEEIKQQRESLVVE